MIRIVAVVAAAFTLTAGGAVAAPVLHGPADVAQSVVDAEHAFAARVAQAGIAQGFREFMDPVDGLSFGGGAPVRGSDAIFASHGGTKPATARLTWEPDEIFAAKAGDMAVSWGHFTYTPLDPGAKPFTGRFVTVWRKNDKGAWKGLVDIGTPD